jgi:hypothetical protein
VDAARRFGGMIMMKRRGRRWVLVNSSRRLRGFRGLTRTRGFIFTVKSGPVVVMDKYAHNDQVG